MGFEFWDVFDFGGKVDHVKAECALVLDVVGNALDVDLGWVQTREDRPLKATLVITANVDDCKFLGYSGGSGNVAGAWKRSILRNNESEITDNVERKAATTFGKVFDTMQNIAEYLRADEFVTAGYDLAMRREMTMDRLQSVGCCEVACL